MFTWLKRKKNQVTNSWVKSDLNLKKPNKLPKNFAKKVIDLEVVCERHDVHKDDVQSLMSLYTVNHCR